jgi:hypothetical protein
MTPYGGCNATSRSVTTAGERFNHNLSNIRTGDLFESVLSLMSRSALPAWKGDFRGKAHFGMRRLGRSGLPNRPPLADPSSPTDNVWDVDCSSFFPREVDGAAIHGAYFNEGTLNLMRHVLGGLDRGVFDRLGYTKGAAWP